MLINVEAEAARDMILQLPVALHKETVPLQSCYGRVLAEDILARIDIPPFDRSPYDGYAVLSDDTTMATLEHPVTLQVMEELPAGVEPTVTLAPGQASRIMTGAPLPPGADAIVKYEITKFTDTEVKLFAPVAHSADVVFAGEDVHAGQPIAAAGTFINGPVVGMLASQGIAEVCVCSRPHVVIINTGKELEQVGNPLHGAKIYDSNSYTLTGLFLEQGLTVTNGGVVPDETDVIAQRIDEALTQADLVVTTGGAAGGDFDCAVAAAEKIGARILFWKVNMRPGGAILAAEKNNKLILSLSGNPGAALLGLLRLALPFIHKLCGRCEVLPEELNLILKKPLLKSSPRSRVLRGRLEIGEDATAFFVENEGQGNGVVSSFVGCNLLAIIPAGSPPLPAGTMVRALRF